MNAPIFRLLMVGVLALVAPMVDADAAEQPAVAASSGPFVGHQNVVTALVFNPNGDLLASTSIDRSVRLWSAVDGRSLGEIIYPAQVFAAAFTPTAARLALPALME